MAKKKADLSGTEVRALVNVAAARLQSDPNTADQWEAIAEVLNLAARLSQKVVKGYTAVQCVVESRVEIPPEVREAMTLRRELPTGGRR